MDSSLKVTDQPQESCFYDIISGDAVIAIPLFQRSYRWKARNLDWLWEDVDQVLDGATQSVFLGIIVSVARAPVMGRPVPWEIVDGQQRLSTLYLILLAAAAVAARNNETAWAASVLGTHLLVRPMADNPVNTKLVPAISDRAQFKLIWDDVLSIGPLSQATELAANPPRPPQPSGNISGAMVEQYRRAKRKLAQYFAEGGLPRLEAVVNTVAYRLSIVSISLRDPAAAPKIFERLNSRAEPVTVADLVRNEVFARASDDANNATFVFQNHWEPFAAKFNDSGLSLEGMLFPYGLIHNPNLTKVALFTELRKHWGMLGSPQAIVEDMEKYRPTYFLLESGVSHDSIPPGLVENLRRIHQVGRPSSVYPFVMRVVRAVVQEGLQEETAQEMLEAVESFLFRRAVLGKEPTGLHAVFKGMWKELADGSDAPGVNAVALKAAILRRTTVEWPSDEEFKRAIRLGDLYGRKVKQFALAQYELARHGETPEDTFQIEHVLPQTITPSWEQAFGERYLEFVNTWANLIPVTGVMNPTIGQAAFPVKRTAYRDSMFATTREVATRYNDWTPEVLEERANEIANWAVSRWRYEF